MSDIGTAADLPECVRSAIQARVPKQHDRVLDVFPAVRRHEFGCYARREFGSRADSLGRAHMAQFAMCAYNPHTSQKARCMRHPVSELSAHTISGGADIALAAMSAGNLPRLLSRMVSLPHTCLTSSMCAPPGCKYVR